MESLKNFLQIIISKIIENITNFFFYYLKRFECQCFKRNYIFIVIYYAFQDKYNDACTYHFFINNISTIFYKILIQASTSVKFFFKIRKRVNNRIPKLTLATNIYKNIRYIIDQK